MRRMTGSNRAGMKLESLQIRSQQPGKLSGPKETLLLLCKTSRKIDIPF